MMYYGSMRKCHFVGISDEIGRGEEWYLYITLLVQQQQQKVVRAMEKEQKTPKMGTDLEELSVTQEIDRDLASKICRNSHRSFEKGPCFVSSKEGCIGISHICPKRGCFSLQRSEAKVWCFWPWPGFSMILPKGWTRWPWRSVQLLVIRSQLWSPVRFCLWREALGTLQSELYSLCVAFKWWEKHPQPLHTHVG